MRAVMAMRVSKMNHFALTVSADSLIGRYDLKARHVTPCSGDGPEQIDCLLQDGSADPEKNCRVFRTQHPGNGNIAIHDEERVCAIGGWDGE